MGVKLGLTLREERRLKVFENWMMRKLCNLYSPNTVRVMTSRRIRWAGHVARMVDMRCAYTILVGVT